VSITISGHYLDLPEHGRAVRPDGYDFLVQNKDMLAVAQWVAENTPFDRLYFYEKDRPIHVSYGPENNKAAIEMVLRPNGRRIPKKLAFGSD
jgi:hypothetical protein